MGANLTAAQREAIKSIVMAPVSAPLAKLLHQVQAQIIREAGERTRDAGDLVLMPLGEQTSAESREHSNGFRCVFVHFEHGDLSLQTASGPSYDGWYKRGVWYGSETRFDPQGREWTRQLGDHVVDDFGTLVPVEPA